MAADKRKRALLQERLRQFWERYAPLRETIDAKLRLDAAGAADVTIYHGMLHAEERSYVDDGNGARKAYSLGVIGAEGCHAYFPLRDVQATHFSRLPTAHGFEIVVTGEIARQDAATTRFQLRLLSSDLLERQIDANLPYEEETV